MVNAAAATGSRIMGSRFYKILPKNILGCSETAVNLVL